MTIAAAQEVPATAMRAAPKSGHIARKVPLALKFAAAFVGLVTLVLLVNGAVSPGRLGAGTHEFGGRCVVMRTHAGHCSP